MNKKNFFVIVILKITDEKAGSGTVSLRYGIRGSGAVPKFHGSGPLFLS
jgi:hypothetical protein